MQYQILWRIVMKKTIYDKLTPKQKELWNNIKELPYGATQEELAEEMGITKSRINQHLKNLRKYTREEILEAA